MAEERECGQAKLNPEMNKKECIGECSGESKIVIVAGKKHIETLEGRSFVLNNPFKVLVPGIAHPPSTLILCSRPSLVGAAPKLKMGP